MNGVYCPVNDVVYEHFLALIKSFRKFNPTLPFTVIKFDDRCDRLSELTKEYNFKVWEPDHVQDLYEIGLKFYPNNQVWAKGFKKICAFWGEYDNFIVLDADIVVVDDLSGILNVFAETKESILYWDFSEDWVYKAGDFRNKMTQQYNSAHINAGIFGGHKNEVSYQFITDTMQQFNDFRSEFVEVMEQPFLNYLIDIKGLKKIPLNKLSPKHALSAWHNINIVKKKDGYYWIDEMNHGKMSAVHWSGVNFSNLYQYPTAIIFLRFRLLGESAFVKFRHFLNFYHIRTIDLLRNWNFFKSLISLLITN